MYVNGHRRRLHRGSVAAKLILPRYYFASATILSLLSYTKMVKFGAIRSVFTTSIHQIHQIWPKCFCWMLTRLYWESYPRVLVGWGRDTPLTPHPSLMLSPSQFSASSAPRHAAPVLIIKKSAPMWTGKSPWPAASDRRRWRQTATAAVQCLSLIHIWRCRRRG